MGGCQLRSRSTALSSYALMVTMTVVIIWLVASCDPVTPHPLMVTMTVVIIWVVCTV